MVCIPFEENEQNKDYLSGTNGSLLEVILPKKLIDEFYKFCKQEVDGNLTLGFERLLSRSRFDSKTQLLVERDEELMLLIQELDGRVGELEMPEEEEKLEPRFFGSGHKKVTPNE